MNEELVVTAVRGESWRCQAVCASGRRCVTEASFSTEHPVHHIEINLCPLHMGMLTAGAVLRVNASAGIDTKAVVAAGGPLDGDQLLVPIDLRVGDTWAVQIEGAATHLYKLADAEHLEHAGARDDSQPTQIEPPA